MTAALCVAVTKQSHLRPVSVECHGDDTPLTFYVTHLFSLLILLVHISKFNVHDTLTEIDLSSLQDREVNGDNKFLKNQVISIGSSYTIA